MANNTKRTLADLLPLPNSPVRIPQLGFGVYKSPPETCVASCLAALEHGYRHIDTAQFYGNEAEVGEALRQSGLPRKEVFLTTKILRASKDEEATYESCADSVRKLDASKEGYVDLFLIHTPSGGAAKRRLMWLTLERLFNEGKTKSIGVSNFGIGHIEQMREYANVWPPHVNQIELHPWAQQREIVDYCNKNGIVVEAYCPLVRNQKSEDPTLVGIAKTHSVTPQQVLVRYALQKGWVPLPKSDNPERIKLNADLYTFDLSKDEMDQLDSLDQGADGAIVQAVTNE